VSVALITEYLTDKHSTTLVSLPCLFLPYF